MATRDFFQRISQVPTNPQPAETTRRFDVADLYRGPIDHEDDLSGSGALALDEKLRQAYFWIVNTAIISPHYDIEYNDTPPVEFVLGDSKGRFTLPSAQSYSSFVLLPLLTFRHAAQMPRGGRPGPGQDGQRDPHGHARGIFGARDAPRHAARQPTDDHGRSARQPAAVEILAHEIGHHVLAPATLTDHARCLARMRWSLPTVEPNAPTVANLYTDLLINDRLQRGAGLREAEVYRAMAGRGGRPHRRRRVARRADLREQRTIPKKAVAIFSEAPR